VPQYDLLQSLFLDAAKAYQRADGTLALSPVRTSPAKPFAATAATLKSRLPKALIRTDELPEAFAAAFARQDAATVALQGAGGTATAFEIIGPEREDGLRHVLRAGMMGRQPMPHFDRVWCPLVLQPGTVEEFRDAIFPGRLEQSVFVQMVDLSSLEAYAFEGILTEVLAGTPYKVVDGAKDFAALPDATPVTVDADVISFDGDFAAMLKKQDDPAWRQQVMATIDANCVKLGLAAPFSWVKKGGDGLYRTKQDLIYSRAAPRP
jgi:hypothetical protein